MPQRKNGLAYSAICQLALAAYCTLLVIATHLPPTSVLLPPDRFDKLYHFGAYAVFAGLLATVWQASAGVLNSSHLRWTWIAVAVFGAMDEITQPYFGRDCSVWDWTADILGAATGLLVFIWLRRSLSSKDSETTKNTAK